MKNPPDIEKLVADEGPIGDAARRIASYTESQNVYRVAKRELASIAQSARAQAFEEAARVADAIAKAQLDFHRRDRREDVIDTARDIAAAIRALTPPEDQVPSETEPAECYSGCDDPQCPYTHPCPAASNGSVADWALVPRAPWQSMLNAAADYLAEKGGRDAHMRLPGGFFWHGVWDSMLAAAPKPPALSTTLPERDEVVEALREIIRLAGAPQWASIACSEIASKARDALSKLKPSREGGEG